MIAVEQSPLFLFGKVEPVIKVAIMVMLKETDEGPKTLVAPRTSGFLKGRWTFPGGKVEPDETNLECVMRETWEETGLRLDPVYVIDDMFDPLKLATKVGLISLTIFSYYYDDSCNNPPKATEPKNEDWRWMTTREMLQLMAQGLLSPVKLVSCWLEIAQAFNEAMEDTGAVEPELEMYLDTIRMPNLVNRIPARALIPKELRPFLGY